MPDRGFADALEAVPAPRPRQPAIVGLDAAGPNADLTGRREADLLALSKRDRKLAECKKASGPDPQTCVPATPPGWADFTATVPAGARWGAATSSVIGRVDVPSQACEASVTGLASGPLKRFQGVFKSAGSWVKPHIANAGDPAKNQSATPVAQCEAAFDALAPGKTTRWALRPNGACAASPAPRGDPANTRADCAGVVAKDYTDWAVADSARLLRHEQQHLALTCAVATKANAALSAGTPFATLDAAIDGVRTAQQTQYDDQTAHGCVAGEQARWEADIAAGLPAVKLT